MSELPILALCVRQPWAWAIIHGGKDIENRTIDAISKGNMHVGRIAICASKGMTRAEYESGANYINSIPRIPPTAYCPPARDLLRGGIIGSVTVADVVGRSNSPWFIEQRRGRGLVLTDPEPCDFIPCIGQLGYWRWQSTRHYAANGPEPALPWMLGVGRVARSRIERCNEPDLFK